MSLTRNVYTMHKAGAWCLAHRMKITAKLLNVAKRLLFPACDIPFSAQIGEGAFFAHRAIGVVIHAEARVGANCKFESNVTIGGTRGKGIPVIGDNCLLGTGCSIIGGVHVGSDVIVGAGAVVVSDVPDGVIVGGVPARVINRVPDEWLGKPKT